MGKTLPFWSWSDIRTPILILPRRKKIPINLHCRIVLHYCPNNISKLGCLKARHRHVVNGQFRPLGVEIGLYCNTWGGGAAGYGRWMPIAAHTILDTVGT